ncbi:MAG: hypothetical protein RDV48_23010 [Candidatus Eremiobacteraeota bacterium]|nr:hypothetical protein [Candidatus Eremiobacteraeota bacterium]
MTGKEFLNSVTGGKSDVIGFLLALLSESGVDYCVIGGLAVNAYAEPVVSLDLDIVPVLETLDSFLKNAEKAFRIERFPHSINLTHPHSDLRIQLQTDERYQDFLKSAVTRNVLGYEMKVASMEDLLRGKSWAYLDEERRKSKRQKDLADILRLIEEHPHLREHLPEALRGL